MGYLCTVVELRSISYRYQQYKSRLYIRGSVHRNSGLKKPNKMQQYADIYLLLITLHVSGVHRAHHQQYIKL
jgi:hypothetical protein